MSTEIQTAIPMPVVEESALEHILEHGQSWRAAECLLQRQYRTKIAIGYTEISIRTPHLGAKKQGEALH